MFKKKNKFHPVHHTPFKNKRVKPIQPINKTKKSFMDYYKTIAFQTIGKHLFKKQYSEQFHLKLKMALVPFTPDVYLSVITFTGILFTTLSFLFYYIMFIGIIQSSNGLLYTVGLTGMTSLISFLYFPFVIQSKISNRKTLINRDLPFALSELSILASTGLTPIKIFRQMATRTDKSTITTEFKKIVSKTDIEGKDLITALSETAKESPSDGFREILWDIANMIHQGGDLDQYMRDKADTTMQVKRDIQKEFIEKLGTYSEMYISLVLVGILFLGIAAFLMDAMGSSMGGLSSESILLLLTYGLIPVAVIVINVIVSMAYSKSG